MILPAKHLEPDRALITMGAELLALLQTPKSVSALWTAFQRRREAEATQQRPVTFDWFILALGVLFALGAVDFLDGKLVRLEGGA